MSIGRITRGIVAATLTTASFAGIQLANPGVALARCVNGAPATTDVTDQNNISIAWETPVAGTCNDNGDYQTTLGAASGWTPQLYTQNGGAWSLRKDGAGSATWGEPSHQSQEFLCAIHNVSGARWCGTSTGSGAEFCWTDAAGEHCSSGFAEYQLPAGAKPYLPDIAPDFGLLNSRF